MNKLVYPMKTVNITQSYTGSFSHNPHFTGTPQGFPIDDAGIDRGRDFVFCPCDEMVITRIYGVGGRGTNTIWLESTTPVITPTFEDHVTIMIIHPEDDDLSKLRVGQTFKRGEPMFREGMDGQATGNHIHLEIAKGKYASLKNRGWVENNKGAWVLSGDNQRPENCFYLTDHTIRDLKGLRFIRLIGEPVARDENKKQVQVNSNILRVRTTPGGDVLGYIHKGIHDVEYVLEGWLRTKYGYIGIGDWLEIYDAKVEIKPPTVEETKPIELPNDEITEEPNNKQFIFECPEDGDYEIFLKKGYKLYLEK